MEQHPTASTITSKPEELQDLLKADRDMDTLFLQLVDRLHYYL